MNNFTLKIKIQERLNKLASVDYDNVECWQYVEAFNKGMTDWLRRNLHGLNAMKEGDEQSKRRIDDFQKILNEKSIIMNKKDLYYESVTIPDNYFAFKRVSVSATNECCPKPRLMKVYLAEESNRDELLRDINKRPSFEWGETFITLIDNKLRVYTNNDFEILTPLFTYYRQPVRIQMAGCIDPYTGQVSTADIECEFKDDLVELFADEAAKILAGDIESQVQMQRQNQSVEGNN